MINNSSLWLNTFDHRQPWPIMLTMVNYGHHGQNLDTMVNHNQPWLTMVMVVGHSQPWLLIHSQA